MSIKHKNYVGLILSIDQIQLFLLRKIKSLINKRWFALELYYQPVRSYIAAKELDDIGIKDFRDPQFKTMKTKIFYLHKTRSNGYIVEYMEFTLLREINYIPESNEYSFVISEEIVKLLQEHFDLIETCFNSPFNLEDHLWDQFLDFRQEAQNYYTYRNTCTYVQNTDFVQ
ncbi:hypothetical protein [Paenibacillus sp. PL91]|uniref:hypothetical protein n=1 Tax=Paenibacillus sp. PL91 TaxID=2729538 RepID=UPI00145E87B5|nr:hypothetical protein [Paenibacillus sp. PL91]MBC9203730.1 hypothetical protein [Paenibacillus sp. PL91]